MLDQIRDLLHRDRFTPFRIILTSGQAYEVTNPDLIALGQSQMNVYRPKSDRYDILRLNQIASVEVLDPVA